MIYLHQIDPIILSLGPLKLHWYGLMYLLAFVTAWWLGRMRASQGRLPGVDANAFSAICSPVRRAGCSRNRPCTT